MSHAGMFLKRTLAKHFMIWTSHCLNAAMAM